MNSILFLKEDEVVIIPCSLFYFVFRGCKYRVAGVAEVVYGEEPV